MKSGKGQRNKSYSFNKHESRDQETEAWWSDPKKNWFKNIIELIIIKAIIKTQKTEDARKNVNEKIWWKNYRSKFKLDDNDVKQRQTW